MLHGHKLNYTKYGWSEETHFKGFDNMIDGVNFEWGYGCSDVPVAQPHREQEIRVSFFRVIILLLKQTVVHL